MLIGGQDVILPTAMVGQLSQSTVVRRAGVRHLPKGEFIHDSISKEALRTPSARSCTTRRRPAST